MQVLPPFIDHQQTEDIPPTGRGSLFGWGGVFGGESSEEHEKVQPDGLPAQRSRESGISVHWKGEFRVIWDFVEKC